jgi:hypothetical protein
VLTVEQLVQDDPDKKVVVDVVTMATCVKLFKQDKRARPIDAIQEVLSNCFTTPGEYILATTEPETPAKTQVLRLENRPNVPVEVFNVEYCADPEVRDAARSLARVHSEGEEDVLGDAKDSSQERIRCTECPIRQSVRARAARLFFSEDDTKHILRAMWNSAEDVDAAILASSRQEWVAPRSRRAAVVPPLEPVDFSGLFPNAALADKIAESARRRAENNREARRLRELRKNELEKSRQPKENSLEAMRNRGELDAADSAPASPRLSQGSVVGSKRKDAPATAEDSLWGSKFVRVEG